MSSGATSEARPLPTFSGTATVAASSSGSRLSLLLLRRRASGGCQGAAILQEAAWTVTSAWITSVGAASASDSPLSSTSTGLILRTSGAWGRPGGGHSVLRGLLPSGAALLLGWGIPDGSGRRRGG